MAERIKSWKNKFNFFLFPFPDGERLSHSADDEALQRRQSDGRLGDSPPAGDSEARLGD